MIIQWLSLEPTMDICSRYVVRIDQVIVFFFFFWQKDFDSFFYGEISWQPAVRRLVSRPQSLLTTMDIFPTNQCYIIALLFLKLFLWHLENRNHPITSLILNVHPGFIHNLLLIHGLMLDAESKFYPLQNWPLHEWPWYRCHREIAGLSGSVWCMSNWWSGCHWFNSCRVRQHSLWRLIMKYFLRLFSPFHWFEKGNCQFQAEECAQYWLTA